MDYNYDLQEYSNSILFQGSPPASLGCALAFQTAEATVPDTSNLLTSSVLIANSMDCISTTAECPMEAEQWPTVSCAPAGQFHDPYFQQQISPATLITPPPELEARGFPPMYPYSWQQPATPYGAPQTSVPISDCYIHGSSLDDSPLSSPGSTDGTTLQDAPQYSEATYSQTTVPTRSRSPLVDHVYGITSTQSNGILGGESLGYVLSSCGTTGFGGTCSMVTVSATANRDGMDSNIPKNVKMPQRKGGIQLWQFLYSLLTDPGKKYSDIIEWTANMREREFRMLEPEAIAIWWGHHKNKPNMSYDKFSRSLRYYYDKGILKKIPGERYVYRFLTDPEQMYRHIGTSDSRPKLKPMPQSAKVAMTKYQKEQNLDFSSNNAPIITPAPEPLTMAKNDEPNTSVASMVDITSSVCTPPPPPYSFNTTANTLYVSGARQCSASTGNLAVDTGFSSNSDTVPMKRSRSLDSAKEGNLEKHLSISFTSHSLPNHNDFYLSGRLSASPVSHSDCNSIPTSQVYTSKVGYGYDSYITNPQMDSYPMESSSSSSTDYYAPHQTIPTNFVTPPTPSTWN